VRRRERGAFARREPRSHMATTEAESATEERPDGVDGPVDGVPGGTEAESSDRSRWWAALAVAPFLAVGLADVLLLLYWGIEPLWGFAILPPILFCSVLAWIVFSTDFLEGRT